MFVHVFSSENQYFDCVVFSRPCIVSILQLLFQCHQQPLRISFHGISQQNCLWFVFGGSSWCLTIRIHIYHTFCMLDSSLLYTHYFTGLEYWVCCCLLRLKMSYDLRSIFVKSRIRCYCVDKVNGENTFFHLSLFVYFCFPIRNRFMALVFVTCSPL